MFKRNLPLSLVIFFLTSFAYSQNDNKKYFYVDKFLYTSNDKNHEYTKEVEDYDLEKKEYNIKVYYKSGKIYLIGTSTDKDHVKLNGKSVYYYENGGKKRVANYVDNHLSGKQFHFHENGNFKAETEVEYNEKEKNYLTKIFNYFDENNIQKVLNGEGEYVEEIKELEETSKGQIKNFLKEGKWIGEIKKKKATFSEEYRNGKFIAGYSIDSLNIKHNYSEIEERAQPKKGIKNFYSYIKTCGIIPNNVSDLVYGKIFINLEVNELGKLENVNAYSEDKFGITANTVKKIEEYENWIPAKHRGLTVKSRFTLPITFK